MAINKNHEFEELNGIKCAIVEKNASKERLAFLKPLLEFNKYEVVAIPTPVKAAPVAATPAPAAAPAPATATTEAAPSAEAATQAPAAEAPIAPPPPPPSAPETYTIGVTNVMFNPINAIFGRLLKTPDGHIVTLAYWQQKEAVSNDEIPYYDKA
ncbi:hypothetical protein [Flavihumibacter sp.]|uniref:hypothetical protein n=1 Tax=Flavihumibacter sp. TaxID=1913981 RepID=UPI002FC839E5